MFSFAILAVTPTRNPYAGQFAPLSPGLPSANGASSLPGGSPGPSGNGLWGLPDGLWGPSGRDSGAQPFVDPNFLQQLASNFGLGSAPQGQAPPAGQGQADPAQALQDAATSLKGAARSLRRAARKLRGKGKGRKKHRCRCKCGQKGYSTGTPGNSGTPGTGAPGTPPVGSGNPTGSPLGSGLPASGRGGTPVAGGPGGSVPAGSGSSGPGRGSGFPVGSSGSGVPTGSGGSGVPWGSGVPSGSSGSVAPRGSAPPAGPGLASSGLAPASSGRTSTAGVAGRGSAPLSGTSADPSGGSELGNRVMDRANQIGQEINATGGYRFDGSNDCYGFVRRVWDPVLQGMGQPPLPVNDIGSDQWKPITDWDELRPGDVLATHQGHAWGDTWHGGLYAGEIDGVHYIYDNSGGMGGAYLRPLPSEGFFGYYYEPTHELLG